MTKYILATAGIPVPFGLTVETAENEATVLKEALGSARAGDWVVVFYESLESTLGHLRQVEDSRRTAIVPAAMTEAVGR
ncbi:MAG: hypothetical protein DDT36_00665 [Firmicutes bacterium]|nr:hypothetical protein [Bacillota bacterium]